MEGTIGLVLAALSAVATNVGFLLRHRGAVDCAAVDPRHPARSAGALFRNRWWAYGFALALLAYLCHAGALATVSLSIVQAVLAGGIVVMAVVAERVFGLEVGRRQWLGVALASAGLILLALTGDVRSGQRTAEYTPAAMLAFAGGLGVLGVAALLGGWRRGHGIALGVSTGLLLTLTHVAFKAASGKADAGLGAVLSTPYPYVVLAGGAVAFFASARSLQLGPAVPVIAVTAIVGNAAGIVAGIVVFGDPLGSDAVTVAPRVLAFALVVAASLLLPAPVTQEARKPPRPGPRYRPRPAHPAA
jgi:drug/metabolite transporter (DMT)-like permease